MHFAFRSAALGLALLLVGSVAAVEPDSPSQWLVPLKGDRDTANLIAISPQGEITFDSSGGKRRMALNDIVAWGAPAEPRAKVQLLLADGGLIALEDTLPATEDNELLAFSDIFGNLKIPLNLLAGVMLHSPIDPQRRDQLASLVLSKAMADDRDTVTTANRDRLLLENGDELLGHIVALTDDGVQFEADVGPLTIERDRIVAIAFDPSLRAKSVASPRTFVGFTDGSMIAARSVKLAAGHLELMLADSVVLAAGDAQPVFLQPLAGQVDYLSDLPPSGYRHIPYLDTTWDYRLDANVEGTRLRADGRLVLKGVGMHSAARLSWQLEKSYHRFQADLAVDDQTVNRGSVVFRIFSGSREIYKSAVVRGGDKPLTISIDIRGVRQHSLLVDYADRADVLDHADWLNARLIP